MVHHWILTFDDSQRKADMLGDALDTIAECTGEDPKTMSCFEVDEREEFEVNKDAIWRFEIFFTKNPTGEFIRLFNKITGYAAQDYKITKIADQDWVSESQKLHEPVEAGRILVIGAHHDDFVSDADIVIKIEAGQAFGTGQHATTLGCLNLIDRMRDSIQPRRILDLGTGSGILAMAAYKAWHVPVLASDIDVTSIDVMVENLKLNDVPTRDIGSPCAAIASLVAEGFDHPSFKEEAPFDLIFANILMGPLIDLAPEVCAALSEKGSLILSGLRETQKQEVLSAYEHQGLRILDHISSEGWPSLLLTR